MIGQTVSHYKILEKLGEGGMGVVYKAEDTSLKRTVALKFLPLEFTNDQAARERFFHEAQAASALEHTNICSVHELGEHDGRTFLVMGFYEGETLKEKIERGPLKIEAAIEFTIQIARGLARAHEAGIVHRDIKPANLIVTTRGEVKILDFGLAKLAGRTLLTRTGSTLGTAAYMSPEQARGESVDHRTDIWSLGVVLYEMIAGHRPYRSDYEQALIYQIINAEPEPLANVRPKTPAGLAQIVGRALEKQPTERYQTMGLLLEDLAAVSEGLRPVTAKPRVAPVKLAVLPLVNLTGDPAQEYLSDGLTQEMIAQLGRLHPQSLSVIARTSVMRYKKTDTPIDQIGRELGVDYVLEGSAQREGARVRVIADLIQVRDQVQLWSDIFEREMSGILALQNDVAGKVAMALALKLLPSEQASLSKARPVNPEAHEAYLRGNYHWMQVAPDDLDIAEKYFDLALEKDPSFAPAYVGRATVWLVRNQMGLARPEEAIPRGKTAALRALELDGNLAGAHEILAWIRTWLEWDWDGAQASWRRALVLNPNAATAQSLYSHFLAIMGHGEEALAHSKRSVELDPFNPLFQAFHAQVLYMQRRYDEAITAVREAQRLQQDHPIATYSLMIITHGVKGMEKEALKAATAMVKIIYNDSKIEAALDEGYARGGFADAMRQAAEALIARLPEAYSMPSDIAIFYAMAGAKEKVIEWLEKGFEVRDPALPYLRFPCYDIARPDPRFQELWRKMNLPPVADDQRR
jgi:serine/threonine protein kinase